VALNLTDTEDDTSRLPWRSSSLSFSQSLSANTLFRGAQRSYNPTYQWQFILEPRWYFNPETYVSIDQRLALELTDSDSTLRSQRALLSDTIVGVDRLFYQHPLVPDETSLRFTGGFHLIAPTSLASRAATLTVGARVRGGVILEAKRVLHGATLALQGRYAHRFLRHDTVNAEVPFSCPVGGLRAGNCEQLGTLSNVRNSFGAIISGTLALTDNIALDVLFWMSYARGTNWSPVALAELGTVTLADNNRQLADTSPTHWRNDRYLVLGAVWTATNWLDIELSLIDYFPEKDSAGNNRGLFNPVDLAVGLSTTITFDRLYLATIGRKVPAKSQVP
jgi:hypothetical protein